MVIGRMLMMMMMMVVVVVAMAVMRTGVTLMMRVGE